MHLLTYLFTLPLNPDQHHIVSRGWFSTCVTPIMSLMNSSAFTGWVFLSASDPNLPSRWTRCYTAVLGPFAYVADLPSRWGLCSSCSDCLVQPPVHRSTVGSQAFSVAGPQVWNCLPPEVTLAPSLATFCTWLKTLLFVESYPDIRLILLLHTVYSGPSSVFNT